MYWALEAPTPKADFPQLYAKSMEITSAKRGAGFVGPGALPEHSWPPLPSPGAPEEALETLTCRRPGATPALPQRQGHSPEHRLHPAGA